MQINLQEKFLPVGTVVLLKEAKKRILITGFCVVEPTNTSKVFDYCGCLFPEGYISAKQNCLFNHNQIEKIFHVGLVDEDSVALRTKLIEFEPKINTKIEELEKVKSNLSNVALKNDDVDESKSVSDIMETDQK